MQGIESVRRDNCALARFVIDMNLQKILIDRDIQGEVPVSTVFPNG